MCEIFKSFIKTSLDTYYNLKNLDLPLITNIKTMVDYLQMLQTKLFVITDFDSTSSAGWTFDYTNSHITNSSGLSKDLVTFPIILNNIRLRKIILEGTSLSTATISYTTSTAAISPSTVWKTIAIGDDVTTDQIISEIPTTGFRLKISNVDSVVDKLYFTFEIL